MITTILAISLLCQAKDSDRLIDHFLDNRVNHNWTLDNSERRDIVSVSATGLGCYAYARAVLAGKLERSTALAYINESFGEMVLANVGNHGWLYHFMDLQGKPVSGTEVSTIDSLIFYLSVERAAELLKDDRLLQIVHRHKAMIDINLMLSPDGYFYHGWYWIHNKIVKIPYRWRNYSEGVLLYKYFGKSFTPVKTEYSLPLFVYFYPIAFYPNEPIWKENLGKAIDYQLRITGRCGYSAMPGPDGYSVNSPYLISPLAITSARQIFPLKLSAIADVDRLTQSILLDKSWISRERVLIDDGFALMLMNN